MNAPDTTRRPRVAFTAGSIAKLMTATGRRYRCQSHLTRELHHIERGQQYVRNALPPHHPDIGNREWWHLRVCLDCCPAEHDPRVPAASPGAP